MSGPKRPRNVQKLDRGVSGRFPVVEAEEPAEAFPAYDRSGPVEVGGRHDELAAQALMVSLLVIVDKVLADRGAEVALTEKHELAEALAPDGTDEALSVGVQVGTVRGQAERGDASRGEEGAELGCVERVAIEEKEALALQEAVFGVEEIPGDLVVYRNSIALVFTRVSTNGAQEAPQGAPGKRSGPGPVVSGRDDQPVHKHWYSWMPPP
jgi:hypothetical protein